MNNRVLGWVLEGLLYGSILGASYFVLQSRLAETFVYRLF